MTTTYDLIFDKIAEGINNAESVYPELTHKDANFLRGFVSDYLDYIAERREVKLDETTTSPLDERSI